MAPTLTFADGFPRDPHARNAEVHESLDGDLRNCDSLWPNVPPGMLFPASTGLSTEARGLRLTTAMERVEWHAHSRQPDSEKWLNYLSAMLRLLTSRIDRLDEDTLLRLAKFGPRLHSNRGAAHLHHLAPVVAQALAERTAPLTPELAEALESLVDHLVRIHDHSPSTFEIAFRLFRSGYSHIPWIQTSDLSSPALISLLDLADHSWQSSGIAPKQASRMGTAIGKVGEANVAAIFNRTVDAIEACQPAPMSGAGMTMLRQMLLWVQARPELDVDQGLRRLCSIRWETAVTEVGLMKEWLGTLLQTLVLRRADGAFACVERLANNPSTKDFREVVGLYEQLMHDMLRDVSRQPETGVDGFPLTNDMHRILDSFQRASIPRPYVAGETSIHSIQSSEHLQIVLQRSEGGYPAMLRAMNERVHWLAKHAPPDEPGKGRSMPWLAWCCDLGKLYCSILNRKPALEPADLAALCKVDTLGWLGVAPTGPLFNACEAWISKNGFHPELTAAMQEWQKSVFGGGTAMALRKQIGWLLWFDTAAPVNDKACWSAIIRKDLRSMPAAARGAWIALLSNVSFGIAEKPTKKWLKPAEKLLRQVDPEDFRSRVRTWFAPFQAGKDLKITIAGRDILGSLFWYSQLAKDPDVDEAVRWFATARWKAKADRDRTARLLPIWIHSMVERCPEFAIEAIHAYKATGQLDLLGTSIELYQELCRRYGRKQEIEPPPPPPPFDKEAMMAKLVQKTMGSVLGGTAQLAGDVVSVSSATSGERYEIGLRDGRILRQSDGKTVRLEIDWSRPPFSPFKSMIDGGDLANPFGRNYFRAMLCAQILSGALATDVPIVVDES